MIIMALPKFGLALVLIHQPMSRIHKSDASTVIEHPSYPCAGCGDEGSEIMLWLKAPLGLAGVWMHRRRECAELARAKHGGGKYQPLEEDDGIRQSKP